MSELSNQTVQPEKTSEISSGLARRQMILASLGKGSAVVAAVAVPMQSLAAIGTLSTTADGRRATISGTMSGVHSHETVHQVSSGWRPAYYSDIKKWPKYNATSNPTGSNPVNGGPGTFNKDTQFKNLFGGTNSDSLITILAGTTDEASWIAAVLNGTTGSLAEATNFPYTAAQVISLYQAGGTTASNALTFFQNYMQTNVS